MERGLLGAPQKKRRSKGGGETLLRREKRYRGLGRGGNRHPCTKLVKAVLTRTVAFYLLYSARCVPHLCSINVNAWTSGQVNRLQK